MTLPAEIARLVETFERNRESYAHGRYSETQLRREYINPFFKTLGWDIDNTPGMVHTLLPADSQFDFPLPFCRLAPTIGLWTLRLLCVA